MWASLLAARSAGFASSAAHNLDSRRLLIFFWQASRPLVLITVFDYKWHVDLIFYILFNFFYHFYEEKQQNAKGMGTEEINLSVQTIFSKKINTKNLLTPDMYAIDHLRLYICTWTAFLAVPN